MGVSATITAPELLTASHNVEPFNSGAENLDYWLKRRALKNQATSASRTFVSCADGRVAGYYALASGAVVMASAPGKFKRNMPNPIPVVLLGRLAVDLSAQGIGLGRALVKDAALRVTSAADIIGIRGILVRALSPEAKTFYERLGFDPSPIDPMTLMITLTDIKTGVLP